MTYPWRTTRRGQDVELVIVHDPGQLPQHKTQPAFMISNPKLFSHYRRVRHSTYPEIRYAELSIVGFAPEQQVLGLEVPMYDPFVVEVFDGAGNGPYDLCCIAAYRSIILMVKKRAESYSVSL